jgi:hypothetical protein
VCACRDGFSGDGKTCADSRPPTILIDASNRTWQAWAEAGKPDAPVPFPTITIVDSVDKAPTYACSAVLKGNTELKPVKTGDPFPVGITIVSCVAEDATHNLSPAASFTIEVMCRPGFALSKGVCTGG